MLQSQDNETVNQDIPVTDNNIFFPQSVLNNVGTDWNINGTENLCLQGNNICQEKEINFGSFQCSCSTLPNSFCDSSWNMGYQFGGNQYTPSACCFFDQQQKKQADTSLTATLNDIEPFFCKESENKNGEYSVLRQGTSNTSTDCRLLSCMHPQQQLPIYNSSFPAQENPYMQFNANNSNNYGYCVETDCIDKLCSPPKSHYPSCILEQNIDISSCRTDSLSKSNECSPDLTPFIPLNNAPDVSNVNESDEDSDIIVEDSDTESEVSIDVGPYINDKEVQKVAVMRCFVCNLSYSEKFDFVQVNSSFPLTFISQTPVMLKLIEIIPIDMQTSVKFENNLICRRCLNLIDMIENLELRLVSVKKALCDFVSRSSKDITEEDWNLIQGNGDICMEDSIVKNIEPLIPKEVNATSQVETNELSTSANTNSIEVLEKISESVNQRVTENVDTNQSNKNEDNIEGRNYQCDRCGKVYRHEKELRFHLKKHFGNFNEKCSDCGKGFMKKSNLEVHMRKHRSNICINCRASFISDIELTEHIIKCTENKFSCPQCKLLFISEEKLKSHTEKHKFELNICSVCSKTFKHPSYLSAHMNSHSDKKPFTCNKCGKSYKNSNHLRRHLKAHDESLKCNKCQKVFSTPLDLKTHLKIHIDEVECEICQKRIAKRNLTEHRKIHLNTKKRKECPICKKMLTTNIKVHMSKHAETKEFKCEVCSIEFTFKHSLTKHLRLKHKEVEKKNGGQ